MIRAVLAEPRRLTVPVPVVAGASGYLLGGPVAAFVTAVYGFLTIRALTHRADRRHRSDLHTRSLDELCSLAADLRAGLPPARRRTAPAIGADADPRVAALTNAIWRLAEHTGAPAADLVERVEADLRAAARARVSAEAQAAGARATAALLAGLPVLGIGLGQSIGVNGLQILLTTPPGAACAIAAVALQCAGLAWSSRLVAGATR